MGDGWVDGRKEKWEMDEWIDLSPNGWINRKSDFAALEK